MKWLQEDKPTTEFNILQNVLSKENRKIRHTDKNLGMGQRPHRKDPSSKKGNLSQVQRILALMQIICFAEIQLELLVPDVKLLETPGSSPGKTSGP